MDRGENNRRYRILFKCNCFNCGGKIRRAEDCRSAKKKIEKSGNTTADRKTGGRSNYYVFGTEKHFAHRHCGLCKSLEHQTRGCEERRAEKGLMLAKMNMSQNSEVALVAAVGATRGDGK